MRIVTVCVAVTLALAGASPQLGHSPRLLTVDEGRQLALEALDPAARKLPKLGLDDFHDPYFPDFYFFEITWDNPTGSVIVDHYAVDPRTGEVWSAIICRKISSPSLRKVQQAMRKRIGVSEGEYKKLRRPGPMCQ